MSWSRHRWLTYRTIWLPYFLDGPAAAVNGCRSGRRIAPIAHVTVSEDELLEKALKRFKRMVEKEGIVREWKRREYFEKPSTVRNKKRKALERKRLKKLRKVTALKRY